MTTAERKSTVRDDLCRSATFTLIREGDDNGDGRTFIGYGAVFNSPTRISCPMEGTFDEQIAPGAFRKSLKERLPKFQFDHGHHPLIGSVPIGTISDIREDERGLYVEARLGQHIIIDLIREAIATGAIDGMSFRFSVVRDEWRDRDGKVVRADEVDEILFYGTQPERGPLLRTLLEVKVAEVGPVVWPAYSSTTASVRSADDDRVVLYRSRLNEPEQRKLLAEMLLRADAANAPAAGGSSEDEPQDTARGVAVEHSDEDTDSPQPTREAGEHETDSETDPAGETRDEDDVFESALAEIRRALELNPIKRGL